MNLMKLNTKQIIKITAGIIVVVVIAVVIKRIIIFKKREQNVRRRVESVVSFGNNYYGGRVILEEKGDFNGAINRFNRLIEKSPKFSSAYFHRGIAYFFLGKYESAVNDFDYSIKLEYAYCNSAENAIHCQESIIFDYIFAYIWKYLALKHIGLYGDRKNLKHVSLDDDFLPLKHYDPDTGKTLKDYSLKLTKKWNKWLAPVARMYLDDISPEACLDAVVHKNPETSNEQKCIAYFHIAQYYLIHDERQKAADFFKKSIDTNASVLEFRGAKLEFNRVTANMK